MWAFDNGQKEKVDFPIGESVENVRLVRVETGTSENGNNFIKFLYSWQNDEQIAWIGDTRWEPKSGSDFFDSDQDTIKRVMEHVALTFVSKEELFSEIAATEDFMEFAAEYASKMNEVLKTKKALLNLKTFKRKGDEYTRVSRFPPFLQRKGEDVKLAYTDWEAKQMDSLPF